MLDPKVKEKEEEEAVRGILGLSASHLEFPQMTGHQRKSRTLTLKGIQTNHTNITQDTQVSAGRDPGGHQSSSVAADSRILFFNGEFGR